MIKRFFIAVTLAIFCLPVETFANLEKTNSSETSTLITCVKEGVSEIEGFTNEIFSTTTSIEDKYSILSKIDSKVKQMLDLFEKSSPEEKEMARKIINGSDCLLLKKSLFAEKKAIAFCHNFAPNTDAAALRATKRLSQICNKGGEQLSWTVCANDKPHAWCNGVQDQFWMDFFTRHQYTEKIIVPGNGRWAEDSQWEWGKHAYEAVKEQFVPYIYSSSHSPSAHVAAWLYKQKYPNTIWIAEFGDPLFMGVDNKPRSITKKYNGSQKFLNSFWRDIEQYVYNEADHIIFTNKNQQVYMLDVNPPKDRDAVEAKSWIWHHPKTDKRYADIFCSNYHLDENNINIGFFGSFYNKRTEKPMLELLKNPRVHIHIFTNALAQKRKQIESISNRIHVNSLVTYMECLNLCKKMDYLFVNDVDFPGKINPYLPSKLSNYLSVNVPVIAIVYPNTTMAQLNEKNLFKFFSSVPEDFVFSLKKINEDSVTAIKKLLDKPKVARHTPITPTSQKVNRKLNNNTRFTRRKNITIRHL